jgi:hypothetical protein
VRAGRYDWRRPGKFPTLRFYEGRSHTMNAYDSIRERTRFEVPESYRRMERDGVLRYGESSTPALLCVYDFQWLTLDEMAAWKPPEYWKPEHVLVPFARTARHDLWCWYPDWASDGHTPVVLAHSDVNESEALAPDFESLLVRLMLEAFAGALTDDLVVESDDRLRQVLRASVEALRPYIRSDWSALLSGLLDRPFKKDREGNSVIPSLLDESEFEELLHREMHFPHAGEVLPHMRESIRP